MSSTTVSGRRHAAPQPGPARSGTPTRGRRVVSVLTNLLLGSCLLAFLGLAVGPHLLGYRTSTMLTASMEPGISPGDVVVTVPKPASEVEVGDVISYQIPVEDHRVETHRVVKVLHQRDGSIAIRTQGDANANVDPWTAILQGDEVWETKVVVPKLGSAIRVFRAPAIQHGIFWVAFGGMLLLGLSTIWSKDQDDPEGTVSAEQEERQSP